ncbi:hypothetical protein LPJ53_004882 [Coemansia erecta]|uniref:Uncharacterized protein n=1 Tax=Coemansia erecta TaxID=147472 RepID=A0A9W7XWU6_9FUNG|nr:hypothetical protein LPJ53_004882 [Coemansia erecta]
MPDFDLLAAAPGLAQLTAAYNLGVLAAAPAYVPPAAAPDFSPLAATPDFDLLAAAPGLAQLDAAYNLGVLDAASAYVTPAAAPDFVPPAVAPAFAPLAAAPGLAQLAAGYNSSTLLATATLDSGGASGISNGLASAVAEAFDLYCAIVALSTEIARPSNIIGDDLVNRISTVFRIINPTAGAVFDNFANSAGGIINSLVNARTASYNGST